MEAKAYDREKAVAYAREWAFSRNPRYYAFDNIGGDCTNFASQALYAGSGVMNFSDELGWFYISVNNRSPSWTGTEYFYNFLTRNQSVGPVGVQADVYGIEPGDFAQISFNGQRFAHTVVILSVGENPSPENILIAAHTVDSLDRPLSTYEYQILRYIHITHINVIQASIL